MMTATKVTSCKFDIGGSAEQIRRRIAVARVVVAELAPRHDLESFTLIGNFLKASSVHDRVRSKPEFDGRKTTAVTLLIAERARREALPVVAELLGEPVADEAGAMPCPCASGPTPGCAVCKGEIVTTIFQRRYCRAAVLDEADLQPVHESVRVERPSWATAILRAPGAHPPP